MSDQVKLGQPYRRTLSGVGVTGSNVDLTIDPVAARELLVIHRVMVKDADSGATRVEVLAGPYGHQELVAVSGALSAGVPLGIEGDFELADSSYVTLRFVGTTTADALSAVLVGDVRYSGGPGVPVQVQE